MGSGRSSVFSRLSFGLWIWCALNVSAFAGAAELKMPSREIQENGESFVLISSTCTDGVETEQYGLKGETIKNWTELIVYQRLALPTAAGANEYILALKRRIEESRSSGKFRIVQESGRAAVFAVEYDAARSASTEFTLGLAVAPEGAQSREIQLIQYTVWPARISFEKLKRNVQRWKARFQSEARFGTASDASGR